MAGFGATLVLASSFYFLTCLVTFVGAVVVVAAKAGPAMTLRARAEAIRRFILSFSVEERLEIELERIYGPAFLRPVSAE